MPPYTQPLPLPGRWHVIGVAAFVSMLALYAAAGAYVDGSGVDVRLYWLLGAAALLAIATAVFGRRRGWQERRGLLVWWAVAALVATILVGIVAPDATRNLPGTITIAFVYAGLTCPRWRSLALVPLGVVAFVVGGAHGLPGELPKVVATAIMWVLVAEVPAWLIARLEEQSAMLRTAAETDALTQLLDRTTLAPRLSTNPNRSAVILIDIDDFKGYNDKHGHDAGDRLLIGFADTLRSSVREHDVIFRIGGDEFLVLLVNADRVEAERVLHRLQRRWAESGETIGFSAGIAAGEQDLMRCADAEMYANKHSRARHTDGT